MAKCIAPELTSTYSDVGDKCLIITVTWPDGDKSKYILPREGAREFLAEARANLDAIED